MDSLKTRNNSIDIFRYVCAVMVVCIHTHPFMDVNAKLCFVFTQIVPRIGVPFFFCVSGYYYFLSLLDGKPVLVKSLKRIMIPYTLWSAIYFALDFIQWGHMNLRGFAVSCVYQYFIVGSHYHLWFIPAMVISMCIVSLLWKLRLKKFIIPCSLLLYLIGCLGTSYFGIGSKIPCLSFLLDQSYFETVRRIFFMGLPFLVAGYVVCRFKSAMLTFSKKKLFLIMLVCLVGWLSEIGLVYVAKVQRDIVITPLLYLFLLATMLVLLSYPMKRYQKTAQVCKRLSDTTYYLHPLVIILLTWVCKTALGTAIKETPMFCLTLLLCGGVAGIICCVQQYTRYTASITDKA